MLIYVLMVGVILLLIILFRYLPRRVFLIFVTLLAVLGGIVFRIQMAARTGAAGHRAACRHRARSGTLYAMVGDVPEADCGTRS